MVHALSEIRRVLVPSGILIDLRPLLSNWPIEVASAREVRETGRLHDVPIGLLDDQAANQSITQAEQNGWFTREAEEYFPFYYTWDSPSGIEEWMADEWHEFLQLSEETKRATRSAWAISEADAAIRVKVKMLITRWKKND